MIRPGVDPYGAFEFLGWMMVVVFIAIWISTKEK
jgi:hypothetical protein